MRSETSGQAFSQCSFSHWDLMSGSLDNPESRLMQIISDVRDRKGHNKELPPLSRYLDKL